MKSDFFNKLNNNLVQASKQSRSKNFTVSNLRSINFSRNQIEDRGAILLLNCLLFYQQLNSTNVSTLKEIYLSKCSLTSKSVNQIFASFNFSQTLQALDLSFNSLKDDPIELFKFLSESNQMVELNLSNTDIDMDKV